jgi:ribosomal protein S20
VALAPARGLALAARLTRSRPPRARQRSRACLWYHPGSRPAPAALPISNRIERFAPLAKTPRTWTGARTPSGLKRVRQAERRREVLQPRRSAAKTFVSKALSAATTAVEGVDPAEALREAISALDRAAKVGAIHPNAAGRRKSRLTIKVNAALGGTGVQTSARTSKTTGKAAATKAAKARIAAGRADKAKGAQTAAGKARAALSRTARTETPAATSTEAAAAKAGTKPATKAAAKPASKATAKPAAAKATTAKPAAKAAPSAKATTARSATRKPAAK